MHHVLRLLMPICIQPWPGPPRGTAHNPTLDDLSLHSADVNRIVGKSGGFQLLPSRPAGALSDALSNVSSGHVQGQVLNETSAWWMAATRHIVGNALLSVPDPNVSIMRLCTVFPVEFVVRGFMTGVLMTMD